MLRTRFTFAVAGAVAAVTLVITAVAFLVVRSDLQNQVQPGAGARRAPRSTGRPGTIDGHIPAGWVPPHSDRFGASSPYAQVVTAQGAVWAPAGDRGLLPADAAAVQVAAGQRGSYYSEATLDGVRAMVLTTPLAPGLAVQLAVPLNTVDTEVASVGATLALLSAIGVALAALAGWGVARAGLAPVGRLAAVAEQVTATGDPAGRVEVDRADELGRLAASFNTMLQRAAAVAGRPAAAGQRRQPRAAYPADQPADQRRAAGRAIPACPRPSARRCSTGSSPRSPSSASWWPASPSWPGASRSPARSATSSSMRWSRPAWRAPGGTGRRPPSRPIWSRASSPAVPSGCRSRSGTCWTTRPSSARRARRWRSACSAGELTVRDHGPGIAPADLPHVFDRFYRAPSARGVPGSGLGLSIVRQVAESHGGTVRAESAPGGGTLIRLRLPARPSPDRGRAPEQIGAGRSALRRSCERSAQAGARYRRGAGAGILQSQMVAPACSGCGGAGRTPCSRRIPATWRGDPRAPAAVGCRPSCARGNVHPAASGSMMITLRSAALPAVTMAWSVR